MAAKETIISDLPAMPLVAQRVLAVAADPNSSVNDLKRAAESDQAIVAKVLRIANSSLYGLSRRVHSLDRAIVAVGFGTVKRLAVAMSMHGTYDVMGDQENCLWQHAVGGSIASFFLANRLKTEEPEAAFTAGLLHDMGKAILINRDGEAYSRVTDLISTGVQQSEAELSVFDVTHSLIGARALKQWSFPESVTEAVRLHHAPGRWAPEGDGPPVLAVALGDMFCHIIGIGCKRDLAVKDPSFQKALRLSGMGTSDVLEMLSRTKDVYERERGTFGA